MEKIKKRIANLKVAGKLKLYRMTVLVMTFFLVLVALISTLVIRSNIEKITEVWSPALEYLQELETMTAKYRIKQYQHLVESDDAVMTSCEEEIQKLESQIEDTDANLEAIMSADRDAQEGQDDYEVANAAWEEYRAASDEILNLSREGKQQEAAKLMTGEVYEEQSASARVKTSANKANEEKEKMNELLTEMEHITEISQEIGNIITDIEDIASQTNLLSLNASIEAARAGEAGRGFAVVADQIGKLAADSAKSAVNTRDLIDKTLVEIEKGNTITRTTADAFNQIIADMESFAEIAENTMEKANSQAESLEQIGKGIEQLSGVVQGNAASSEENTAISVNLAEGAAKMHDRVNIFKLF